MRNSSNQSEVSKAIAKSRTKRLMSLEFQLNIEEYLYELETTTTERRAFLSLFQHLEGHDSLYLAIPAELLAVMHGALNIEGYAEELGWDDEAKEEAIGIIQESKNMCNYRVTRDDLEFAKIRDRFAASVLTYATNALDIHGTWCGDITASDNSRITTPAKDHIMHHTSPTQTLVNFFRAGPRSSADSRHATLDNLPHADEVELRTTVAVQNLNSRLAKRMRRRQQDIAQLKRDLQAENVETDKALKHWEQNLTSELNHRGASRAQLENIQHVVDTLLRTAEDVVESFAETHMPELYARTHRWVKSHKMWNRNRSNTELATELLSNLEKDLNDHSTARVAQILRDPDERIAVTDLVSFASVHNQPVPSEKWAQRVLKEAAQLQPNDPHAEMLESILTETIVSHRKSAAPWSNDDSKLSASLRNTGLDGSVDIILEQSITPQIANTLQLPNPTGILSSLPLSEAVEAFNEARFSKLNITTSDEIQLLQNGMLSRIKMDSFAKSLQDLNPTQTDGLATRKTREITPENTSSIATYALQRHFQTGLSPVRVEGDVRTISHIALTEKTVSTYTSKTIPVGDDPLGIAHQYEESELSSVIPPAKVKYETGTVEIRDQRTLNDDEQGTLIVEEKEETKSATTESDASLPAVTSTANTRRSRRISGQPAETEQLGAEEDAERVEAQQGEQIAEHGAKIAPPAQRQLAVDEVKRDPVHQARLLYGQNKTRRATATFPDPHKQINDIWLSAQDVSRRDKAKGILDNLTTSMRRGTDILADIAFTETDSLLAISPVNGEVMISVKFRHFDGTNNEAEYLTSGQVFYVPVSSIHQTTSKFQTLNRRDPDYKFWKNLARAETVNSMNVTSAISASTEELRDFSSALTETLSHSTCDDEDHVLIVNTLIFVDAKHHIKLGSKPNCPLTSSEIDEEVTMLRDFESRQNYGKDPEKQLRRRLYSEFARSRESENQLRNQVDVDGTRVFDTQFMAPLLQSANEPECRAQAKCQGLSFDQEAEQIPVSIALMDDSVVASVIETKIHDDQLLNLVHLAFGTDVPHLLQLNDVNRVLSDANTALQICALRKPRPQILCSLLGMKDVSSEVIQALRENRNLVPISTWFSKFTEMVDTHPSSTTTPLIYSISTDRMSDPSSWEISIIWQQFLEMIETHLTDCGSETESWIKSLLRNIAMNEMDSTTMLRKTPNPSSTGTITTTHLWSIMSSEILKMSTPDLDLNQTTPDIAKMFDICTRRRNSAVGQADGAGGSNIPLIDKNIRTSDDFVNFFARTIGDVPYHDTTANETLQPTVYNVISKIQSVVHYCQSYQAQEVERINRKREFANAAKGNDNPPRPGNHTGNTRRSRPDVGSSNFTQSSGSRETTSTGTGNSTSKRNRDQNPRKTNKKSESSIKQVLSAEKGMYDKESLPPEINNLIARILKEGIQLSHLPTAYGSRRKGEDHYFNDFHEPVIRLIEALVRRDLKRQGREVAPGRMCTRNAFRGACTISRGDHASAFSHDITPEDVWKTLQAAQKYGPKGLQTIIVTWMGSVNPCPCCLITNDDNEIVGGTPVILQKSKNDGVEIMWHSNRSFDCGFNLYFSALLRAWHFTSSGRNGVSTQQRDPPPLQKLQNSYQSINPPGLDASKGTMKMTEYHPLVNRVSEVIKQFYEPVEGQYPQPRDSSQPPIIVNKKHLGGVKRVQFKEVPSSRQPRGPLSKQTLDEAMKLMPDNNSQSTAIVPYHRSSQSYSQGGNSNRNWSNQGTWGSSRSDTYGQRRSDMGSMPPYQRRERQWIPRSQSQPQATDRQGDRNDYRNPRNVSESMNVENRGRWHNSANRSDFMGFHESNTDSPHVTQTQNRQSFQAHLDKGDPALRLNEAVALVHENSSRDQRALKHVYTVISRNEEVARAMDISGNDLYHNFSPVDDHNSWKKGEVMDKMGNLVTNPYWAHETEEKATEPTTEMSHPPSRTSS